MEEQIKMLKLVLENPANDCMSTATQYEKACKGEYLEKYRKNGDLLLTAEKFNKTWIVSVFHGKDIGGEYSEEEFEPIRKKYFKQSSKCKCLNP